MEDVTEIISEPLGSMIKKLFNRIGCKVYFNILEAEKYDTASSKIKSGGRWGLADEL